MVESTLGDVDASVPLLKLKPTADKYNFKERIRDLEGIIQPLKDGLSEQMRRRRALSGALVAEEGRVNANIFAAGEEFTEQSDHYAQALEQLAALRKQDQERVVQLKELRESLDAAQLDLEPLQARVIHQARRADEAEATVRERDATVSRLRDSLEESRSSEKRQRLLAAEAVTKIEACQADCKAQLEQAAGFNRKQTETADAERQQLLVAAQEREAKIQALQEALSTATEQLDRTRQELDGANLSLQAEGELTASLRLDVTALTQEASSLSHDLSSTQADLASSRRLVVDLEGSLQSAKEEHEKSATTFAAQRHSLEGELAQERAISQTLREDLGGARAQVQGKTSQLEELTREHSAQSAELLGEKAELQRLRLELVAVEAKLGATREELASASVSLRSQGHEAGDLRKRAEASVQEAADVRLELSSSREKVSELQSALRRSEQEQERLRAASAHDRQVLEGEASSHKAEVHRLQEELSLVTARLGSTREELAAANASLRTGSEQNSELHSRAATNSRELADTRRELSGSRQQYGELQTLLRIAEEERDRSVALASSREQALTEELAQAHARAAAQQEESVQAQATLKSTREDLERTARERHVLEVEFHSYKEHHGSSNHQQMEAIADLKVTVDRLTSKVESSQSEVAARHDNICQQQVYIESLEQKIRSAETDRRELHNAIQELKGNIRVFCRVRPPLPDTESALQSTDANKLSLACSGDSHSFAFDKVFAPCSTQAAVYDEVAGLVQSALDGYKVCIFAYGQTGSGKTFTMQGTGEHEGLIPRSLKTIFRSSESMRAKGWEWTLKASFMEVYNETFRDLLPADAVGSASAHVIKHDDEWGSMVTNMTIFEVTSLEQISMLMAKAARQRAVGQTDMNAVSSRSHSIFALYLRGVNKQHNSELHGALHLVDLAGSERLQRSGATGDRLKETQNINRSLSSLADVFLAKSEGRGHVPFRNSKLTHLMEPCLSGHGKTLMLVNVGPEQENSHETLCSLRFAGQVSQCTTGGRPKRHSKPVGDALAASSAPLGSSRATRPPTPATARPLR